MFVLVPQAEVGAGVEPRVCRGSARSARVGAGLRRTSERRLLREGGVAGTVRLSRERGDWRYAC